MNFGGTKVEGSPQTNTPKLKLFILSRLTHEIFMIGKYIKKGFDKTKFGGIKMVGPAQMDLPKFKFLTA